MKTIISFLAACIFISFFHTSVYGTHIRAGEITAKLISCLNFTYEFALTGYTDLGSDIRFGAGEMNFGDGTIKHDFEVGKPDVYAELGNEIALNIFYVEHTFPGPGVYTVSYRERDRNDLIVNMDNSVKTPYYVETVVIIDPFLGCNSTPELLNPPIDDACIGVTFLHNAGAVDADGDSVSYEFTIPKQDVGVPVVNYRFPDENDWEMYDAKNEDKTGPASIDLDQKTGDVVWDAPGGEGEYNIAFRIVEWRKIDGVWYPLGYVTRDMQIIVYDCDNEPPEIEPPPDTCVVAGDLLIQEVFATDPDNDPIVLSSFGSVYEINSSPASYSPYPDVPQNPPAKLTFSWQTDCSHVRERAYQVNVKAVDLPDISHGRGPALADFASWFIRVVGPPPEGLMAEQGKGNKVELSWEPYLCDQATSMQVWRRVDSYEFDPGHCELGMPSYAGYEFVTTLDIDEFQYTDTNNGQGLQWGATYCYRLVAVFQDPAGGESIVSTEACVVIEEFEGDFGSLITNVDVRKTDSSNGEIFVKWTSPFDIDGSTFPPPYTYELYRGEGFSSSQTQLISGGKITDTTFVDTGLNTTNAPYNYRVVVYDSDNNAIDTTATASSVRLDPSPITGALELHWRAEVPWSNVSQEHPYHLIYRDNITDDPKELVLIDSVNVSADGFVYLDDGSVTGDDQLINTQAYCYYVVTNGTYGNPKILEPLINNSQIACAHPNDMIKPCTPKEFVIVNLNVDSTCINFVNEKPCEYGDFFNELNWEVAVDGACDEDIRSYKIYFSETGEEGAFELIDNVVNTSYVHQGLISFKGCYKISAVDRSGNESELTEAICNDNCPFYELPNVFTPNNDGMNDTFHAFDTFDEATNSYKCPRFVRNVDFYVYDRNGKEVYNNLEEKEKHVLIHWQGINHLGKKVPSGIYYYLAEVTFDMMDERSRKNVYKGWINLIE
ncbi:MAG: gliding motility-associated C-terminal domain-containing protein [Cytophagales bacterium]|nr:gliding motility-associated C-terminal domain-containing protein [Cytophagales bacterium]